MNDEQIWKVAEEFEGMDLDGLMDKLADEVISNYDMVKIAEEFEESDFDKLAEEMVLDFLTKHADDEKLAGLLAAVGGGLARGAAAGAGMLGRLGGAVTNRLGAAGIGGGIQAAGQKMLGGAARMGSFATGAMQKADTAIAGGAKNLMGAVKGKLQQGVGAVRNAGKPMESGVANVTKSVQGERAAYKAQQGRIGQGMADLNSFAAKRNAAYVNNMSKKYTGQPIMQKAAAELYELVAEQLRQVFA